MMQQGSSSCILSVFEMASVEQTKTGRMFKIQLNLNIFERCGPASLEEHEKNSK